MQPGFPYWFLLSELGVTVDQDNGVLKIPDGFGAYTLAHGTDFCVALFSTEALARESMAKNAITGCVPAPIRDKSELRDLATRFKDDHDRFVLNCDSPEIGILKFSAIL